MQKYTCTSCSYIYNPFIWEEDIIPGTDFETLAEDWVCPHCGDIKESFIEAPTHIQEASSINMITEEELSHIPFYKEQWDQIIVHIGSPDTPHEIEENHFIEYIGLFETDGEIIDMCTLPEESVIFFENPWLEDYEVRLSCNIHGVWRGIKI